MNTHVLKLLQMGPSCTEPLLCRLVMHFHLWFVPGLCQRVHAQSSWSTDAGLPEWKTTIVQVCLDGVCNSVVGVSLLLLLVAGLLSFWCVWGAQSLENQ